MDLSFLHVQCMHYMGVMGVSILVLMDLPFLRLFCSCSWEDPGVSILVLMDLSFLLSQRRINIWVLTISFNPCSYGSFVLTWKSPWHNNRYAGVSILVLMDLSFLPELKVTVKGDIEEVSILVLMDLSFLHNWHRWTCHIWIQVSILVLMDLSFLLKPIVFNGLNPLISFNPCSYGSFVLT